MKQRIKRIWVFEEDAHLIKVGAAQMGKPAPYYVKKILRGEKDDGKNFRLF